MDIRRNALEGVCLGISNKEKVIKLNSYKECQNFNAIILAESGRGMNSIHKAMSVSELNQNAKEGILTTE